MNQSNDSFKKMFITDYLPMPLITGENYYLYLL